MTKCYGLSCQIREKCFRYVAPHQTHEQYFQFIPHKDGGTRCVEFWDVGLVDLKAERVRGVLRDAVGEIGKIRVFN